MKYFVNKSFTVNRINDNNLVIMCSGNLSKFECDYEILLKILEIVETTNSIESVYEYYSEIYEKDNIAEFIQTLISAKIIMLNANDELSNYNIAVIGNKNNFEYVRKMFPDSMNLVYLGDCNLAENSNLEMDYDCIVLLPGNTTYEEILKLNKNLYKYEIPFIIFRFTGESFTVGPLVLPWNSSCLECQVQQHLNLLNKVSDQVISIDYILPLSYSVNWDNSYSNYLKYSVFSVLIEEVKTLKNSKYQYKLLNKEIIFNKDNLESPVIKTYTATSKCSCCHNINKNYTIATCIDEFLEPKILNPFDGSKIIYKIGGLRSVSSEDTKKLLDKTLEKLDLGIEIKRDYSNPFSDIAPVYHSILKANHKNATPYLLSEQFSQGKGIGKQQAYFSASFELFERISARYFGEMNIIRGKYKDLKKQCADISSMVEIVDNLDAVYDVYDQGLDIDWVWGYSLLSNKPKLIPASLVFLSSNSFMGNFAPIGSSGLSAGATLKDAIVQGLFELIEHDAWMIGQANMVKLPIVTYEGLKNQNLKSVIGQIKEKGYNIISRDYTNDLGIPVIRTWIVNPRNYKEYALSGFGSSVYPELALERSITEAIQTKAVFFDEEVTEYGNLYMDNLITAKDSLFNLSYFQVKDIKPEGKLKSIDSLSTPKTFNSVDSIFEYAKERITTVIPDADILYVDLTRESIGIPVARAFITKGTQLIGEPTIVTSSRLFSFQKNMGYLDREVSYEELYLSSYPH